ncbi:cilia- and flagella-associated protein 299-like [Drosophila novamexicana]|uniref:cilia- and flagella-associated protein 299-like n=1 Tax=Drosophila novamexicana TaxID=47314 RepID=UPI0011E5D89D|nr:cilia- and flagella-associated protein 299-like [Drosophila novamexicana]
MPIRPDFGLLQFENYSDYIKSFISIKDQRYMESSKAITQFVKLGYRTTTKIYECDEFEYIRNKTLELINPRIQLGLQCGQYIKGNDPGLRALAEREVPNLLQKLSTIIFLVVRQPSGFDISGYIDYTDSLHSYNLHLRCATNWKGVFEGRCKLRPKPTDLSYYDLHKKLVISNNSGNYQTMHFGQSMAFMHRGDHKVIHLDSHHGTGSVKRSMIQASSMGTLILYDHVVRKPV